MERTIRRFASMRTLGLALILTSSAVAQDSTSSNDRTSLVKTNFSKFGSSDSYDPREISENSEIEILKFEIEIPNSTTSRLRTKSNGVRSVPVKVYLPEQKVAPVVLFSHGLGGSREGFKHGGEHWAKRGYVAVFIQHPGSDESVWKDKGLGQRMNALRDAANAQNLMLRIDDVKGVIDYLEKIEKNDSTIVDAAKRMNSRMDLNRIGMSGHSFGAITTQMVSGQSPAIPSQSPTDPRIKAAVIFSPSPPKLGKPEKYFVNVSIPWLLMTGTKDNSPIGDIDAETRLQVFANLPPGNKYQVVFEGGTHAFLGERVNARTSSEEMTSHAQATVAIATAFWDTYLKEDASAKEWLNGNGPRKLLNPKDSWEKK